MGDDTTRRAPMHRRHRSPQDGGRARESGGRIRYTADEWALIRAAADRDGDLAIGAWVCQAALDVALGQHRGYAFPRAEMAQIIDELRQIRTAITRIGGHTNQLAAAAAAEGALPTQAQLTAALDFIRRRIRVLDSTRVELLGLLHDLPGQQQRRRRR